MNRVADIRDGVRDARHAGETKYTVRRMLRFSLDAIASFSHLPLQLATYVGLLSASVAFIAIPVVIVLRIAGRVVASHIRSWHSSVTPTPGNQPC